MTIHRQPEILRRATTTWSDADPALKRRLISIFALLIALNIAAWAALLLSSMRYGLLLSLAPVAYGFGLRHAVDPDHIAAIDNTTRKLMQDGKRPVAVGFFFSLGHSTVVFVLSLLLAAASTFVRTNLPQIQSLGAVIGTSVSGGFLLLIAVVNLVVLADVYKTWQQVIRSGTYDDRAIEAYLDRRGLLARLFRPVLKTVTSSWNMYLVGLLFGLGFDTASEVGILGMSATAGAGGMPVWHILLLPILFVAGMSLIDTADGVAMLGAYGWAYVRPMRKLYYNLNITLLSVIIALFIGGVEVLSVISTETGVRAGPFGWAASADVANLGYVIIGTFVVGWLMSAIVYRLRGIDRVNEAFRSRP